MLQVVVGRVLERHAARSWEEVGESLGILKNVTYYGEGSMDAQPSHVPPKQLTSDSETPEILRINDFLMDFLTKD